MVNKKCDICGKSSGNNDYDTLVLGDWMNRQELTVHYFCLLLSTNLAQRGGDSSGILGFLLRDIRLESIAAKKRTCFYCAKPGASLECHKCRRLSHLTCSFDNHSTIEFFGEFRNYCEACQPLDDYKRQLIEKPPKNQICDICFKPITPFRLYNVSYGDCCKKGFAHRICMRKYALASGYYLRCIWCRTDKFRDIIRKQSVFVPDRDATWERQKDAYQELHRKHMQCIQVKCLCPNGRDYNKGSWTIFPCKLCASTGAHLKCVAGISRLSRASKPVDFKCEICLEMEQKIRSSHQRTMSTTSYPMTDPTAEQIEMSFYVTKSGPDISMRLNSDAVPVFSDEESITSSDASVITVIASQRSSCGATVEKNDLDVQKVEIMEIDSQSDEEFFPGLAVRPSISKPEPKLSEIIEIGSQSDKEAKPEPKLSVLSSADSTGAPDMEFESLQRASCSPPHETPPPNDRAEEENIEISASPKQPYTKYTTDLVIRKGFACPNEPFFYLEFYEFNESKICTGTCCVRFADDDPRIRDRSPEALRLLQVTDKDIWYRTNDIGIYAKIYGES
ncbi:uncharacterized protein LOC111080180 isoform X2 [Drosophila obscura]|uniref:uncharacterized protein LOC111080180 isoform X2 n=1 Tax=Drosophila obscura TaxID=7282 RepID=UPI001BB10618|nr:uncharacterized protein LOC111080180 isoform X2 [Drosophila obscura]